MWVVPEPGAQLLSEMSSDGDVEAPVSNTRWLFKRRVHDTNKQKFICVVEAAVRTLRNLPKCRLKPVDLQILIPYRLFGRIFGKGVLLDQVVN